MENNEGGFGISTVAELQMIDEIITSGTATNGLTPNSDINFYLMNDIDASSTTTWNEKITSGEYAGFDPIGTSKIKYENISTHTFWITIISVIIGRRC
mgnify:CR=1 FL=1